MKWVAAVLSSPTTPENEKKKEKKREPDFKMIFDMIFKIIEINWVKESLRIPNLC